MSMTSLLYEFMCYLLHLLKAVQLLMIRELRPQPVCSYFRNCLQMSVFKIQISVGTQIYILKKFLQGIGLGKFQKYVPTAKPNCGDGPFDPLSSRENNPQIYVHLKLYVALLHATYERQQFCQSNLCNSIIENICSANVFAAEFCAQVFLLPQFICF